MTEEQWNMPLDKLAEDPEAVKFAMNELRKLMAEGRIKAPSVVIARKTIND